MKQKILLFLATGFYSGYLPKAPGTFGSLVAIPLLLASSQLSFILFSIITVISFIIGIEICNVAGKYFAVEDHPSIVWDEIVGMFVTFLFLPITLTNLTLGFALFRLFDILKPYPIKQVEQRYHGGLGVMLDDVVAGIFAGISLLLINIILQFS